MPHRLPALLTSVVVVAAAFLPALPAQAEEVPTPETTSSPAPTSEVTTDETSSDETVAPEETVVPEEIVAPEQTPSATPTPTPSATATGGTVDLSGIFVQLSEGSDITLFNVIGQGYLNADVSQLESPNYLSSSAITFALPEGLTADSSFAELADYSSSVAPLVAIGTAYARGLQSGVSARVNQTPNTAATHKIFAVLVSPSNTAQAPNQTSAQVASAVGYANTFWSSQTAGTVKFALAGTTGWYKSSISCQQSTSSALWNEAAAKAKAQLGYTASKNNHLVLFLPSSASCGGPIGLGTVGYSANSGGLLWTIGTNSDYERATLVHELGHNLSLGHANWLDCTAASPNPGVYGTSGCTNNPYGDVVDVMGYGAPATPAGALSSPNAIRAGLWPSNSWTTAGAGTQTYTLNSVTSNSGLRSVIIPDDNGVNYFVEFRNFTGLDAPYASKPQGCAPYYDACLTPTGVRVLRFEQSAYQGVPGDDTYLISRTVSGVKKANFVAGEVFTSKGGSGVKVTVVSTTSTTATIQVQRASAPVKLDYVDVIRTLGANDSSPLRVGETLTAFVGSGSVAENYTYQWIRNGKSISGANQPNYVVSNSDRGSYVGVRVTATSTGQSSKTYTTTSYGPVKEGVYAAGTVAITTVGNALQVSPQAWPSGTTFKYQWYRGSKKIKNAKNAKYTPTASDTGKAIRVRVIASTPGYKPVTVYTASRNYSITAASGGVKLSGSAKVGGKLTITNTTVYRTIDGTVAPKLTYQWLRNGKKISGATAASYTLTAKDYKKKITVRVTATLPARAPLTQATAAVKIAKGQIKGNYAKPLVQSTAGGLRVALPATSITESGVKYKYSWLRNDKPISKANKSTYKLTDKDYGKVISVRITVVKSNYTDVVLKSTPANYSIVPNGAFTLSGAPTVGQVLTAVRPSFRTTAGEINPNVTYQWLRNGKSIKNQRGQTYTLTTADKGKKISVKVVVSAPTWVGFTATTAAAKVS